MTPIHPPVVWLLNLDAELELTSPNGYTPSRQVLRFVNQNKPRLSSLTGDDQILCNDAAANERADGKIGLAWCPTPYACQRFRRANAVQPQAPALACLQRVNHRAFNAQLGQCLPNARVFNDADQLLAWLSENMARPWLIKRGFGFAGRGQRRTRTALDADDQRWIRDAFKQGAVQVEPFVEIAVELAHHGFLTPTGAVQFGEICVQQSDEQRAWANARRATSHELDGSVRSALFKASEQTAEALHHAGYHGPFGVDSFLYRDHSARLRFNPRSEINARFTMGYGVGMPTLPASAYVTAQSVTAQSVTAQSVTAPTVNTRNR